MVLNVFTDTSESDVEVDEINLTSKWKPYCDITHFHNDLDTAQCTAETKFAELHLDLIFLRSVHWTAIISHSSQLLDCGIDINIFENITY